MQCKKSVFHCQRHRGPSEGWLQDQGLPTSFAIKHSYYKTSAQNVEMNLQYCRQWRHEKADEK